VAKIEVKLPAVEEEPIVTTPTPAPVSTPAPVASDLIGA